VSKLRRANIDGAAGATEEIERIVAADPQPLAQGEDYPAADSGFCL